MSDPLARSRLPTQHGEFTVHVFADAESGKEHLALTMGEWSPGDTVICRLHSECLTGDVLGSLRCDCGEQLRGALRRIAENGSGVLLYLRQEGRGIGLANKIRAYALQDAGADTVEANEQLGFAADSRDYQFAVHMLRELGVTHARVLTNNPRKLDALSDGGIVVVERLAHEFGKNPHNEAYLYTKASKLGHLFGAAPAEDAE